MIDGYIYFIIASFVFVSATMLAAIIYTRFHWLAKALLMALALALFIGSYGSIRAMVGWPAPDDLPARFLFMSSKVDEPGPDGKGGAIYLWIRSSVDGAMSPVPRAYRLPYSRETHKQVQDLIKKQGEKKGNVMVDAEKKDGDKLGAPGWLRNQTTSKYDMKVIDVPIMHTPPKRGFDEHP